MQCDHLRQFAIEFTSKNPQNTNFSSQVREVIDSCNCNADVPWQRTARIIQISGFIHSTMRRIDFSFLFDNRDIVITRCQRKHFYFSLSAMSPWIPIQCNVTQSVFLFLCGVVASCCCWTNGKYHKIINIFFFHILKPCDECTNKRLVEPSVNISNMLFSWSSTIRDVRLDSW